MIEEELLEAWIRASLTIRENQFLNNLSYNEICVYDIIRKNDNISFKEIRLIVNMQKSQLNRVLDSLVSKKLINKNINVTDKRSTIYSINLEYSHIYDEEHNKVLEMLKLMIDEIGEDNAVKLTDLLNRVVNRYKKELEGNKNEN